MWNRLIRLVLLPRYGEDESGEVCTHAQARICRNLKYNLEQIKLRHCSADFIMFCMHLKEKNSKLHLRTITSKGKEKKLLLEEPIESFILYKKSRQPFHICIMGKGYHYLLNSNHMVAFISIFITKK